jgi:hypothetical protein
MTPRALLTVIGATAIGFAIAIGSVAGFAADTATPSSSNAADGNQAVRVMTLAESGAGSAALGTASMVRTTSRDGECLIA